jgi:hypothetical protein
LVDPIYTQAVSTQINRDGFTEAGGTVQFHEFFAFPLPARQNRLITWNQITTEFSPIADVCEIDVMSTLSDVYSPGTCSGDRTLDQSAPVWKIYQRGDQTQITLPTLPSQWPRSDFNGFKDPNILQPSERQTLQIRCQAFDRSLPSTSFFGFKNMDWSTLQPTHIGFNKVDDRLD